MKLSKTRIREFLRSLHQSFTLFVTSTQQWNFQSSCFVRLQGMRDAGVDLGIIRWSPCCAIVEKAYELRRELACKPLKPRALQKAVRSVFESAVQLMLTPAAKKELGIKENLNDSGYY